MRILKKRVLSALLTLAMLVGMLQPMAVEAAEATALSQNAVKAVTVSDTAEGTAYIETIYDGNAETFWTSKSGTDSAYLTIELDKVYNLTRVDYSPRYFYTSENPVYWECTGNIKNLIVQVSEDGERWTTVTPDGGLDLSEKIGRINNSELFPVAIEFTETAAKYVKVTATASYHWQNPDSCITVGDLAVYAMLEEDAETVEKNALTAKIAELTAENLVEAEYTADTWTAYTAALEEAKTVAENEEATQEDVNTALEKLTAARTALAKAEDSGETTSEKITKDHIRDVDVSGTYQITGSAENTSGSLTFSDADILDQVYDESASTYWNSNHLSSGSITSGDPYLTFKLDAIYKLTKLDFTPRWDSSAHWKCTGNIKTLVVEVSEDGQNWTDVTNGGKVLDITQTSSDAFPVSVEFSAERVRYVRISGTASHFWKDEGLNKSIAIGDAILYGSYVGVAPVDRSELEAAITKAKSLDQNIYTEETRTTLQAALTAAEAVAEDATQDVVDKAADTLTAAIDGLKTPKPMQNAEEPLDVPTFVADGKKNGEAVHPDIVDMTEYGYTEGWHGYKYYMATTPNQNGNSQFENPCLVASNDGLTWETPAGITNPLTNIPEEPTPYHNCDADLVYNEETDELYLYYIWSDDSTTSATNGYSSDLRFFEIAWDEEKEELYSVSGFTPIVSVEKTAQTYSVLSPSVVKDGNIWKMWCVNTEAFQNGYRSQVNHVDYRVSEDGINWSEPVSLGSTFDQQGYVPWHVDVAKVGNEYWAVFPAYPDGGTSAATDLFYAKSSDGLVWTTYDNPLLTPDASSWDDAFIYRSTFLYDDEKNTFRLWYSGGASSSWGWRIGYTENNYANMVSLLGDATTATGTITAPECPTVAATDKTDLANAITEAKTLVKTNYTAESWAVFEEGLALAEAMNADTNATQAEVDALETELARVKAQLVAADFTEGTWTIIDNADSKVSYKGTWVTNNESAAYDGTNKIANDPASYAEFTFQGTALRWYGQKDSNFGNGKIYVDGQYVAYVNAGDAVGYKKLYAEVTGLENKEHTVQFYPTGPASGESNWVELDYIEVSKDAAYEEIEANAIETSADSVKTKVGGEKTIAVFAKNNTSFVGGAYTVSVADNKIATAVLNGNEVTITGVAVGKTKVTIAMGEFTKDIEVTVKEASTGSSKLTVSNESPLLLVPIYCQEYVPDGESVMQWGDTLVGRWSSIPDDIKPYTVMLIHVGNCESNQDSIEGYYTQQLEIAEENEIPVMLVTVTAGLHSAYTAAAHLTDEFLEEAIQEYDCLKGFVFTENYWTMNQNVVNSAARHLTIAAENGGYTVWFDHNSGTNVVEYVMSNENFKKALEQYGKNFAFAWKNTPVTQNASTASYLQGLWLNGTIDQWGGLMDTWKWFEKGMGKLFQENVEYNGYRVDFNYNSKEEETRACVMEPEALLGIEMLSIYANGGCIYSFEHPAYTQGVNDKNTPLFTEVIYETLRYAIKNPAPSREEIIADTEVVIYGNTTSGAFTGVIMDDQSLPTYSTGQYGLLPSIPTSVTVIDALADKVVNASEVNTAASLNNYLADKYTDNAYEGTAFAQKLSDSWVVYNSNVNENENQDATISVAGQTVKVEMEPHTFAILENTDDGISVYLNNYRVNKDEIWDNYGPSVPKWDPDVNELMQNWLEENYMNNPVDGENTYRETTFTLTDLEKEPVVNVTRQKETDFTTTVDYDAETGTAVITVKANGYVYFTIGEESDTTVTPDKVDKSALESAINNANKKDKDDYTSSSWKALEKALEAAKAVYADTNATQTEVDTAALALNNAIAGLESSRPTTVVITKKEESKKSSSSSSTGTTAAATTPTATGDSTDIALMISLLGISAVALVGIFFKKRKA